MQYFQQDTAGQERFSSLSTAFFRGADAALLMFDVNAPETMQSLKKWWGDFCDKAPVRDQDVADYCCVVVGNKIDMAGNGRVSESEALEFVDELVPHSPTNPPSVIDVDVVPPHETTIQIEEPPLEFQDEDTMRSSQYTVKPPSSPTNQSTNTLPLTRTSSIAIATPHPSHSREPSHSPKHQLSKSRSRSSSSRFYSGTMTTTHTTLTIFHTPSSSLFDVYQSARSSPEPWTHSESDLTRSAPVSPQGSVRRRRLTSLSTGSTSSGSAATITPSLFARERENAAVTSSIVSSPLLPLSSNTIPIPPERGAKLFFTSAKTGDGVNDVFEYIAQRVVRKWEYDEWVEARRMHFREASSASAAQTIRLQSSGGSKRWNDCCSS